MRPLTERTPKPLIEVGGQAMIDYALDCVIDAGIDNIVVNVHHLAGQLIDHLSRRGTPGIAISDETDVLMDSGGGIVKALPLLGSDPFIILNADTFWVEQPGSQASNLQLLMNAWDAASMDMLLMTTQMDETIGYGGRGDFLADNSGRLQRHDGVTKDPLIYPGVAILNPVIFDEAPRNAFSLNRCFDAAIKEGRLFGVPAQGLWLTVGTPEAIVEAERAMNAYQSSEDSNVAAR